MMIKKYPRKEKVNMHYPLIMLSIFIVKMLTTNNKIIK